MSIGDICNRSVRAALKSKQCQVHVTDYCNKYAKKLLGDDNFEFDCLPDAIVEAVFYGSGITGDSWATFLKDEVRNSLNL